MSSDISQMLPQTINIILFGKHIASSFLLSNLFHQIESSVLESISFWNLDEDNTQAFFQ